MIARNFEKWELKLSQKQVILQLDKDLSRQLPFFLGNSTNFLHCNLKLASDIVRKHGKTEKHFCPGIQIAKTIFNYGIWKKIDLWNIGQVADSTALVSITSLKPEELRVTTENNMKNKQEILTACSVILTFELKNIYVFLMFRMTEIYASP